MDEKLQISLPVPRILSTHLPSRMQRKSFYLRKNPTPQPNPYLKKILHLGQDSLGCTIDVYV
jgi:hypothetical protein